MYVLVFVLVLTNPALTETEAREAGFDTLTACYVAQQLWRRQNVETECRPERWWIEDRDGEHTDRRH